MKSSTPSLDLRKRPPAPSAENLERRKQHLAAKNALKELEQLTGMAAEVTSEAQTALKDQLEALAETDRERSVRQAHERHALTVRVERVRNRTAKRARKRSGRVRRLVALTTGRQYALMDRGEQEYWDRLEIFLTDPSTRSKDIGSGLNKAANLHQVGLGELVRMTRFGREDTNPSPEGELAYQRLDEDTRIALAKVSWVHLAYRIGRGH